jgi:hypothetical protein
MAGPFVPNSELVGVAWVKSLAGIDQGQVAMSLPGDASTWRDLGFVELTLVGGSPARDYALREPVFQVDAWANNGTSSKAPWGMAFTLAEAVLAGTYGDTARRLLVIPGNFRQARVLGAFALSEPRRIEDDTASYARVQFDLQLVWVER